jgi:O-antigen ligase
MIGLPAFLGVAIGFLISRENLLYAVVMALLIPLGIIFLKRPFIGVIIWLLLGPLYFVLPNPDLMHYAFYRILVPFTLLIIILFRMLKVKDYPPLRLGAPELAMCILAAYVPISLLYSQVDLQDPLRSYIDRILVPFCMYLIVRISSLDNRDLKSLRWVAFITAVIQLFIGFLWMVAPQLVPHAWRPVYYSRLSGTLANPNIFAVTLFFCICLLFQAAMDHKSKWVRFAFIIVCGLSFIGCFLSMERAVWLAGIIVFLGLFILFPKPILKFSLIISIVILIFGVGILSPYISKAAERIGQKQQVYDRIVITDAMIQMIQIKPIFGWGYNTLNDHIAQFYRVVGAASMYHGLITSHNTYLTIMTEQGVIGLLLYMFPLLWCFFFTIRVWQRVPWEGIWNRKLLAILWLYEIAYFIVANIIDMRFFPFNLSLSWMTLGLIANLLNQHSATQGVVVHYLESRKRIRGRPFDKPLFGNKRKQDG